MLVKRLQSFFFVSFFALKRFLQFIVKTFSMEHCEIDAVCSKFESNKVAKLYNVSRAEENKTRKVKKQNEENNGRGRYGNSYTK